MKVQDFKDLVVWQKAKELTLEIYRITMNFPQTERFGLISQIRRAVISIPSNIAEGYARQHTGEFIQFLYIAMGSAAELETQLLISEELKYVEHERLRSVMNLLKEIQKMLNGLLNSLRGRV